MEKVAPEINQAFPGSGRTQGRTLFRTDFADDERLQFQPEVTAGARLADAVGCAGKRGGGVRLRNGLLAPGAENTKDRAAARERALGDWHGDHLGRSPAGLAAGSANNQHAHC